MATEQSQAKHFGAWYRNNHDWIAANPNSAIYVAWEAGRRLGSEEAHAARAGSEGEPQAPAARAEPKDQTASARVADPRIPHRLDGHWARILGLEDRNEKLEDRLAKLEEVATELQAATNRRFEVHMYAIDELSKRLRKIEASEASQALVALERRIDQLGNVNTMIVDRLDGLRGRLDSLTDSLAKRVTNLEKTLNVS